MTQQKNSEFETEPNIRLSPRYFEAVAYASGLHAGQTRKGTSIPYMSHLLGVSSLVIEALGDEDQAIAALLHDAAEDCGGEPRLVEIGEMFGPRVALIVRGCSDSLVEDPTEKEEWKERKEAYIKHVADAHFDVIVVSCADKLNNARALWTDIQRDGVRTMTRFNATGRQTAWYYSELLRIFTRRNAPEDLLIPLRDVVFNLVRVLENPSRVNLFRPNHHRVSARTAAERTTPVANTNKSTIEKLQAMRAQLEFDGYWVKASIDTAEELFRMLPKTRIDIREYLDQWEIALIFNVETPVAIFRSDGTFQAAPDWRMRTWSGVKEGGPDNIASSIIWEFGRSQGERTIETFWSRIHRGI